MLQNYTSSMILLYSTLHISNIKLDLNCRKTFTEHIQPPYFAEPSQAEEMATCSKWTWAEAGPEVFFLKDKWRHQRLATASTMFICLIPTVRTEKKNHFASTEEFSRIPSFASNDFFNFELQQDDTHFKYKSTKRWNWLVFFSEVLSSVHTDVDIQSCPVFQTPPPTIVSQQSAAPQPLGAEYVTGGSTSTTTSTFIILLSTTLLPLLLQLWVVQQSWSKGLWSQVTRKSYHTQMQIADKSVFFCDLTHCQSNKRSSCGKEQ